MRYIKSLGAFIVFILLLFYSMHVKEALKIYRPKSKCTDVWCPFVVNIFLFIRLFICIPFSLYAIFSTLYCHIRSKIFTQRVKQLKSSNPKLQSESTICFRVVTRGLFPDVIKENLNIHTTLLKGTFPNLVYTYEIVTDHPVIDSKTNLPKNYYEVVVPREYETKTGALYKARALQYALEKNTSQLKDNDWIVHLGKLDTLYTDRSLVSSLKHLNRIF